MRQSRMVTRGSLAYHDIMVIRAIMKLDLRMYASVCYTSAYA